MFSSNPIELIGSLGTVSIVVLLILLFFSVFSWAIIVSKWRTFQAMHQEEAQFHHTYEAHATDFKKLRSLAKKLPSSPSGAVFLGVMNKIWPMGDWFGNRSITGPASNGRWPERHYLEKVVQSIVQNQISQQEAYLPFLATTGNITPFIGLFGTVLGIINAFHGIGLEGTASIAAVAPGIAEALVATAAGLFAAIPAVVAYNYYLTKVRKTVHRVEAFTIEFLNSLEGLASEIKEAEVVR